MFVQESTDGKGGCSRSSFAPRLERGKERRFSLSFGRAGFLFSLTRLGFGLALVKMDFR